MGIFKPGDKIQRTNQNYWWLERCEECSLDPYGTYTVHSCSGINLICTEWIQFGFKATPANFGLAYLTTEEMIAARIKKLYSKCKTTAHWA